MTRENFKARLLAGCFFLLVVLGCGPLSMTFGRIMLFLGVGVAAAAWTVSVIAAPLVEESAKRIGIARGMPWMFVGIFAAAEFVVYLTLQADPVLRIPAVVMHFGTMMIQQRTTEMSRNRQGWKKPALLWGGWLAAVLIHALFNWAVLNVP
jgi:hypothetical protein